MFVAIRTLQALILELYGLNRSCTSWKSTMQLTKTISPDWSIQIEKNRVENPLLTKSGFRCTKKIASSTKCQKWRRGREGGGFGWVCECVMVDVCVFFQVILTRCNFSYFTRTPHVFVLCISRVSFAFVTLSHRIPHVLCDVILEGLTYFLCNFPGIFSAVNA